MVAQNILRTYENRSFPKQKFRFATLSMYPKTFDKSKYRVPWEYKGEGIEYKEYRGVVLLPPPLLYFLYTPLLVDNHERVQSRHEHRGGQGRGVHHLQVVWFLAGHPATR